MKAIIWPANIDSKKTVIVGENELETGLLQIKDMTSGEQVEVPIDSIVEELTK